MTKKIQLTEKVAMPVIGFGTSRLTGEVGAESVKMAIEAGYRHIDTADQYHNHEAVAEGIKHSGISRAELFITTKIQEQHLARADVLTNVPRYLEELQTEYVDLLLIHWPNAHIPVAETLYTMKEFQDAGKVRVLGVSNFTERRLEEALATGVEIKVNQVEMHPTFNQQKLRAFCKENGIVITAYAPLGRGADLELPVLLELAQKYHTSVSQVILAWELAHGVTIIPRSHNLERIKQNLAASELTLEAEDIARIDTIPQGERIFDNGADWS